MPTQWRSIAAIVGRTAAQCLERYEKLLDAATGGEGEDARKLRVGEVDPSPETKPALPDAVDMEEEEKEMLQEARARMANTSGKKVKRKAREKAMEEGRRLSVLQRKRELKAAGIDVGSGLSRRKLKKLGPDWNAEVPFMHSPLAGFHDASAELAKPPPPVDFKAASIKAKTVNPQDLEDKRRKADLAKEKARIAADPLKALEELHKAAADRLAKIRRASHLNTPAAQLSDADLKTISKFAYDPDLDAHAASSSGTQATRALLAPYSASDNTAITSTPSKGTRADPLQLEAAHQAYQRTLQTPLLGVAPSPQEHNAHAQSQLKLGAYKDALSTPNPLATPLARSGFAPGNLGSTPQVNKTTTMAPPTHMEPRTRDHFGLNTPSLQTPASEYSPLDARAQQRQQAHKLHSALSALPAPKRAEIELNLPADFGSADAPTYVRATHSGPMDVAELERTQRIEAKVREEELFNSRSTVLKRGLPRPSLVPKSLMDVEQESTDEYQALAQSLLDKEVVAIISHDSKHWPVAGAASHMDSDSAANFDLFSQRELADARALLEAEMESIKLSSAPVSFEEFRTSWVKSFEAAHGDHHQVEHQSDAKKKKTQASKANATDAVSEPQRIARLQKTYQHIQHATAAMQKKLDPMEKKLSVVQGGFGKRNEALAKELDALVAECLDSQFDLTSFQAQLERERLVQPQRLQEAQRALETVKQREKELQSRYQTLMETKVPLE